MPTSNNKRLLVSVCAAGAAIALLAGSYYYVRRPKKDEDEETLQFGQKAAGSSPKSAPPARATTEKQAVVVEPQVVREAPVVVERPPVLAVPPPAQEPATTAITDPNVKRYEEMKVQFRLPRGWKATQDVNMMLGVAMVSLEHEDFPNPGPEEMGMPGEVPVLVLTVEDISMEALTIDEFKEKSKMVALQQLMMLTRGMVMPNVNYDGPKKVGPFQLALEYSTELPPIFSIKVMNLIAERDGFAYVLQLMANGQNFDRFKKDALALAESLQIDKITSVSSKTRVLLKDGHQFDIPAAWAPGKESEAPAKLKAPAKQLLHLHSPSPTKTESIVLFAVPEKQGDALANEIHTAAAQAGLSPKGVETFTHDQKTIWRFATANHGEVLVWSDVAWFILPKHGGSTRIKRADLLEAVLSVAHSEPKTEEHFVYTNQKYSYQFEVVRGSKLVEPRFGDISVNYAPEGVNLDASEPDETPLFSVRAGELEAEDPKTLEEWKAKLAEDAGGSMLEQEITTIAGRQCFTFAVKEMQETMEPGVREEKMARVYIFLHGEVTVMFRWECPTGSWPRYLPKLNKLLQTVHFNW
eukprot:TRINITY_DN863_c0_g1_i1.p1 TRINITY_DN863_c0_g1~~TRINITY_DN863_c0_g1_i1.p1  ORF type:complete len:588 (-),score=120.52 TRINITY_DN863_c0_g1_i1:1585-3327(-)